VPALSSSEPPEERWTVAVGLEGTSAAFGPAASPEAIGLFVCGPSAGGHLAESGLLRLTGMLRRAGLAVVTFNFLYREQGRRRPDPMPLLQQTFAAVVAAALERTPRPLRLLLGGRSMGGRVASMLAADGFVCDGLLLFAYPLHPAGEPERLRSAHLPRIAVPTLCFNGTRDRLCRPDLMEAAVAPLAPRWTMHWLEGADHSFDVPRGAGRTEAEVLAEIDAATRTWLASLKRD
jgi:predicted alpha/beta-hydrolase family hydrolase